MQDRIDSREEQEIKAALEVLKNIEVPAFHPIAIEQLILSAPLAKQAQTPVLAFMSSLVILTCAALFVVPLLNKAGLRKAEGVPTSCLIQSVTGKNAVVRASKANLETAPAHAGMFLEEGSKIQTGEESEVRLRADSEVNLIVSQNAELEMTQMRMIADNLTKNFLFSLTSGRMYCEVNGSRHTVALSVVTPDAQFQVWGTKFEIISKPDSGTHIGVYEGDVLITPRARGAQPFHVLGGFQTLVAGSKKFKPPVIQPLAGSYYKPVTSGEEKLPGRQTGQNPDGILTIEDKDASDELASIDHIFEDRNVIE